MTDELHRMRAHIEALECVLLEVLCSIAAHPTAPREELAERIKAAALATEALSSNLSTDDVAERSPLTLEDEEARRILAMHKQFMALTQAGANA